MGIHKGVPSCTFKGRVTGADGRTTVRSHAVGWAAPSSPVIHSGPCLRRERRICDTAAGPHEDVTLVVNEVRRKSTTRPSGVVDSPCMMSVAGTSSCNPPDPPGVGCDYVSGWVDYVRVEAAPLP